MATPLKVAYQGVPGAYSEQTAKEYFTPKKVKTIAYSSFEEVFQSVESKTCQFGVIPIENSLAGSIVENYDLLNSYRIWICGEYKLRVQHNLIAQQGAKISIIKSVYSHPQALAQCRASLQKLKIKEICPFFDTAGAVKMLSEKPIESAAAIASAWSAEVYGMKILRKNLEDNHRNYTRFAIIGKYTKPKLEKAFKTTIAFSLKSTPGALHKALSIFAIRDIDLGKIESRPIAGKPWQYTFYIDLLASLAEQRTKRSLAHLEEVSEDLHILGSYSAHHH